MVQWRLLLLLLVSLETILSVSGIPAPPLEYRPIDTVDGLVPSWHAWEPDANFRRFLLRTYVQAAHAEMLKQAAFYINRTPTNQWPSIVASLWVKNKGIYTASDMGKATCYVEAPLHPKTQALFDKYGARPNKLGGHCSCIQVINGFHEKFPDDDIPPGSAIAIYGHRTVGTANKLVRPCRTDKNGTGCIFILSAANIDCVCDPNAPAKPRTERGSKRPHPDRASSPRPGPHSYRKVIPDLNSPPDPEVNSDVSESLSSGDSP